MWISPAPRHLRLIADVYSFTGFRHAGAFTLVELLVVIAVMVLTMTLAIPAYNSLRGAGDFTSEVYSIAGLMDEARAYAMANHTYVLAGLTEVSATQDTDAASQTSGIGRIAVAIVASKSGARPYQNLFPSNLASYASVYSTGTAYVPVGTLMSFQNIHLAELQPPPTSGNMYRPLVAQNYDLSNASGTSTTRFAWPVGLPLGNTAKYSFSKVIEYDPQGSARVILASNSSSIPEAIPLNIEIGLEPTHGTMVMAQPQGGSKGQIAAIQISGITGSTHIYRP